MMNALYDYFNKVIRRETVNVGGKKAKWMKVKNLKIGAKIAVPNKEVIDSLIH